MIAIFLDQETTGLDPMQHHVIEIAFKIVDLNTNEIRTAYQTPIKITSEEWNLKNPSSLLINEFSWEELQCGKERSLVREEIIQLFILHKIERGKAVFICQNPSFDRPFFLQIVESEVHESNRWPYHWLDLASMFWTRRVIECKQQGQNLPTETILSKDSIAEWYKLPIEAKPHRAMNGVEHLIRCYKEVFV